MGIYIPKSATPVQANRIITEAVTMENSHVPPASRPFQFSLKSRIKGRVIAVPPQRRVYQRTAAQDYLKHDLPRFMHSSASTVDSEISVDLDISAKLVQNIMPETTAGEIGFILSNEKYMTKWRRPHHRDSVSTYAEIFTVQNRRSPFQRRI